MKLFWQNDDYVEILKLFRSDQNYYGNLNRAIESYQHFVSELNGRSSNVSDDIFEQVILQIKNVNFREIIQRIHLDVDFWQAYMKFDDAIDGEYDNINYCDDNVNCSRYYNILTFFVISHMDCPLAIENDRADLDKWIEIRAQIQEDRVPIDSQGTYQHMLGGVDQLDQVGLINIVRYYNWLEDIRDFLNAHYHLDANGEQFNLFKQEKPLILMGSSGVDGFNRSLAFAEENVGKEVYFNTDCRIERLNRQPKRDFVKPNSALMKFEIIHNKALGLQRTPRRPDSPQSKQIYLRINVCQSSWDKRYRSAVCTILFVNEIIKQAIENGKPLAILDMRVPQHVHIDDANGALEQDRQFIAEYNRLKDADELSKEYFCHQQIIKTDNLFKLVGIEPFLVDNGKGIVRIGNTSSRNFKATDEGVAIAGLKALYSCGYRIDALYTYNRMK